MIVAAEAVAVYLVPSLSRSSNQFAALSERDGKPLFPFYASLPLLSISVLNERREQLKSCMGVFFVAHVDRRQRQLIPLLYLNKERKMSIEIFRI